MNGRKAEHFSDWLREQTVWFEFYVNKMSGDEFGPQLNSSSPRIGCINWHTKSSKQFNVDETQTFAFPVGFLTDRQSDLESQFSIHSKVSTNNNSNLSTVCGFSHIAKLGAAKMNFGRVAEVNANEENGCHDKRATRR